MDTKLRTLQEKYAALAARIGHPQSEFLTERRDDGSPHMEMVNGVYNYVVTERGSEWQRRSTSSEYEALQWLVDDLTWGIASGYELAHRIAGEDSRRQMFAKQIELLTAINPEWAAQKAEYYRQLLLRHPFNDSTG